MFAPMNKALGWTLAVLVVVVGAAFGARLLSTRVMNSRALTSKALGVETPASDSLPFARLTIPSGNRTLVGWWVPASADSGAVPAVLFLHGNRSTISDCVPLLRFFHRQRVSAMVFDYSGFGASGGSPSLGNAIEDAGNAARIFADSARSSPRRVAFGSALGATVLLQAIDSVQPHVTGVVLEGVAASVRESAVRDGRIPRFIAPLVVDIGDNVAAARRVTVPLLAVHSFADSRFPFTDAERVVEAVPGRTSLVRHWRKGHSSLLSSSRACDWAQVLTFVRTGALPAAKVDTVDACAEEARAAAERVRADSIRQDSIARAAQARTKSTTAKPATARPAGTKTVAPAPTRRPPARRP